MPGSSTWSRITSTSLPSAARLLEKLWNHITFATASVNCALTSHHLLSDKSVLAQDMSYARPSNFSRWKPFARRMSFLFCPCCGSKSFRTLRVTRFLTIESCTCCDFMIGQYPNATLTIGYNRIDMSAYQRSIAVMRRHEALRYVSDFVSLDADPKRWLDIGCGMGAVLSRAKQSGFDVFGIEPDPIAREQAGALVGHENIVSVDNAEAFPLSSFGVVSLLDVLEHLQSYELDKMAARVAELLVPGGYWLIKVPSSQGLFFRVAHFVATLAPELLKDALKRLWLVEYASPHRVYFNESNLELFLNRNGFERVARYYTPTVPINTILARLRVDSTIRPWKMLAMIPAICTLNALERLRGTTDSLVVIARRR